MTTTSGPIEVARNAWGVILHHPAWQTVELTWLPSARQMSDSGFRATLELLASVGEQVRPRCMLIDATEFDHAFGAGTLDWREQYIIPRYNAAGVSRFAFIVPEGTPGTVETGASPHVEGSASFPTGWFQSRERAYAWLEEPVTWSGSGGQRRQDIVM
jgi:hypothetical protein